MSSLPPRPLISASVLVFAVSLMLMMFPFVTRLLGDGGDVFGVIPVGALGLHAVLAVWNGSDKARKRCLWSLGAGIAAAVLFAVLFSIDVGSVDGLAAHDFRVVVGALAAAVVSDVWLLLWVVQKKHARWFERAAPNTHLEGEVRRVIRVFPLVAVVFGGLLWWRAAARDDALFDLNVEVVAVDGLTGKVIDNPKLWSRAWSGGVEWGPASLPKYWFEDGDGGIWVRGVSDRPLEFAVSAEGYVSETVTLSPDSGQRLEVRLPVRLPVQLRMKAE
ncbi:hypothetical protein [Sulfuriroseicoccus oceanibius]|uniref:Uncharacterized protein n=1 Tax=Sulfuriroseicoccus oceanibius TaxID=2707525 RepID=A0A6B3LC48_9BACT|nr:hypothetical protein [Sulfuriroseicoccus oceanibius]QQL45965.1 hypothetical protein G3M56_005140 [Sulfuriroseicoccus oceanibius]